MVQELSFRKEIEALLPNARYEILMSSNIPKLDIY